MKPYALPKEKSILFIAELQYRLTFTSKIITSSFRKAQKNSLTDENEFMAESYPMNGGDGTVSYARNSFVQRTAVDASKKFINEAIVYLLDVEFKSSNRVFRIADLGCATGPNTFFAVQNIMEAIDSKYSNIKDQEYQVFFNDHTSNDFNVLFRTIPSPRQYFPVGVPGSFHGRLFPNQSIHVMHSSNSLHWLSRVPDSVADVDSPAWNGHNIYCEGTVKGVYEAYSRQYKKDMENFLNARASELAPGGLLVLVLGGVANDVSMNQTFIGKAYDILGSCLFEMAKNGVIREEKVKSFNMPLYFASASEIEGLVKGNGCFSIERMQTFPVKWEILRNSQMCAMTVRASIEATISNHFGNEIVEELFELYTKKHMEKVSILMGDVVKSLLQINVVLNCKN